MALNMVTLTMTFPDVAGQPATGSVDFAPSVTLVDATDSEIVPVVPVTVTLVGGTGTVSLVATDNASLNPTGWSYRVTEKINGADLRTYGINLPHLPATVDLASVTAVPVSGGTAAVVGPPGPPGPPGSPGSGSGLPTWQPATAYTTGQKVISPNNDVVSAVANFTSGATYNPANWVLSTTFLQSRGEGYNDPTGKPDQIPLTAGYALDKGTVSGNVGPQLVRQQAGVWTIANPGPSGTTQAGYVEMAAAAKIRFISVELQAPLGALGTWACVLGKTPWCPPSGPVTAAIPAGIHFSMTPITGYWACSVWNPGVGSANHIDDHIVPYSATAITLQVVNGGGTFTTPSIVAPTAASIQAALQALTNVGAGNALVVANNNNSFSVQWAVALGATTSTITASVGAGTTVPTVLHYVAGTNIYSTGTSNALNDANWHTFQLTVSQETNTAWVLFPDGTAITMTHPGIGAFTDKTWVLEPFANNTSAIDVPLNFRKIGWSSVLPAFDQPYASKADVQRIIGAASVKRIVKEYVGTQTTSGITVPAGNLGVRIRVIAPGAGGGSGSRQAPGTGSSGGGAGGSGSVTDIWIPPSITGAGGTINIVIPAPGTGGSATTVDSTFGTNGVGGGGNTTVAFIPTNGQPAITVRAATSSGGGGGTTTTGAGGTVTPLALAIAGGAGFPGAATLAASGYSGGPGASGGGGGVTAANVAGNGAAAGTAYQWGNLTGTPGGVVDTTVPLGGAAAENGRPGDGAAGGAGSITAAAQAGADANGIGAGGGGGGGSRNGFASGRGGNGGPGSALIEILMS